MRLVAAIVSVVLLACTPSTSPRSRAAQADRAPSGAKAKPPHDECDHGAPPLATNRDELPKNAGDLVLEGRVRLQPVFRQGWSEPTILLDGDAHVHLAGDEATAFAALDGRRVRAMGRFETLEEPQADVVGRLVLARGPVVLPARPEDVEAVPAGVMEDEVPSDFRLLIAPQSGPFAPHAPLTASLAERGERVWVHARRPRPTKGLELQPAHALDELQDVVFVNVDDDNDLEWVILATWMTGIGPRGAVPFRGNRVVDFTARGIRQLPEVEARVKDADSLEAVEKALGRRAVTTAGAPNLLRVLAIARKCATAEPYGGTGRGGSSLVLDRNAVLNEGARGVWSVTFAEEAPKARVHGLEVQVDPVASTCEGRLVTVDAPQEVANAAWILRAARRCAFAEPHRSRGAGGSALLLHGGGTLVWRGDRRFLVHFKEAQPSTPPGGLDLLIDENLACHSG